MLSDLPGLLAKCQTAEEFAEYDRIEAELLAVSSGKWVATTLGEVAEVFGLAVQTVKQWRMESPPMPGEPGAYPIPEIVQWRLAKLSGTDLTERKKRQEIELAEIQIESKRLDLEREKGNIIERGDIELWVAQALIELREGVMQLPEILVAASPPEVKSFVRTETDRHCRDLLAMVRHRLEQMPSTEGEPQPA